MRPARGPGVKEDLTISLARSRSSLPPLCVSSLQAGLGVQRLTSRAGTGESCGGYIQEGPRLKECISGGGFKKAVVDRG